MERAGILTDEKPLDCEMSGNMPALCYVAGVEKLVVSVAGYLLS